MFGFGSCPDRNWIFNCDYDLHYTLVIVLGLDSIWIGFRIGIKNWIINKVRIRLNHLILELLQVLKMKKKILFNSYTNNKTVKMNDTQITHKKCSKYCQKYLIYFEITINHSQIYSFES